jgi:hypothetical protein
MHTPPLEHPSSLKTLKNILLLLNPDPYPLSNLHKKKKKKTYETVSTLRETK